jgi:hypothetical protein
MALLQQLCSDGAELRRCCCAALLRQRCYDTVATAMALRLNFIYLFFIFSTRELQKKK